MTEETKKAPAKKPAAKKPAAAKAATKKPAAETQTAAQAEPKKEKPAAKKPAGKTLRVVQTGSPLGRQDIQRRTLIGLGLNKRHRERELEDTPAVRGMIYKVRHLVKVVGE